MQILPGPKLPEQVCQVLDLAPSWVEISFHSKTHGGSKDLASSNNRWYGVKASRSPRWILFYIKPLATALPHGHCLLTLECEMLLYFYNKYQDNQHVRKTWAGSLVVVWREEVLWLMWPSIGLVKHIETEHGMQIFTCKWRKLSRAFLHSFGVDGMLLIHV